MIKFIVCSVFESLEIIFKSMKKKKCSIMFQNLFSFLPDILP